MARKEESTTDEAQEYIDYVNDPNRALVPSEIPLTEFQTADLDQNLEPANLSVMMEQAGLKGERITAAELIGQTFTIYRLRPFRSSFDKTKHAYFCVIRLSPDSEWRTLVLGGSAIVEMLDFYVGQNIKNPLTVTLDFVEGGAYGGYYQFV